MPAIEFENIKNDAICFLPVRVGETYFEGKNFEAILKTVNDSFKECIILFEDPLPRSLTEDKTIVLKRASQESYIKAYNTLESLITIPKTVFFQDDLVKPEALKKCSEIYKYNLKQTKGHIWSCARFFLGVGNIRARETLILKKNSLLRKALIQSEAAMHEDSDYRKILKRKEAANRKIAQTNSPIASIKKYQELIREKLILYMRLAEWLRENLQSSSANPVRPIYFCLPFVGDKAEESFIHALKILLHSNPNIIFTNIPFDITLSHIVPENLTVRSENLVEIYCRRAIEGLLRCNYVIEDQTAKTIAQIVHALQHIQSLGLADLLVENHENNLIIPRIFSLNT